jgi:hypothetical protein
VPSAQEPKGVRKAQQLGVCMKRANGDIAKIQACAAAAN